MKFIGWENVWKKVMEIVQVTVPIFFFFFYEIWKIKVVGPNNYFYITEWFSLSVVMLRWNVNGLSLHHPLHHGRHHLHGPFIMSGHRTSLWNVQHYVCFRITMGAMHRPCWLADGIVRLGRDHQPRPDNPRHPLLRPPCLHLRGGDRNQLKEDTQYLIEQVETLSFSMLISSILTWWQRLMRTQEFIQHWSLFVLTI